MKNLFFLSIFSFMLLTFSSCEEDESLNPLAPKIGGQFVKIDFDKANDQLIFDEIDNTSFRGMMYNQSGNVVKYELYVQRRIANVATSDYVLLDTYTSFPHQMEITPALIASALNISVSDLRNGDQFRFLGYSYDAAGNKCGFNNLSRTVQIANFLEQGYKFNTHIIDRARRDGDFNNRQI